MNSLQSPVTRIPVVNCPVTTAFFMALHLRGQAPSSDIPYDREGFTRAGRQFFSREASQGL